MHARNKLIAAVYAASPAELERAAIAVKAALRGAGQPARPRSLKSLYEELGDLLLTKAPLSGIEAKATVVGTHWTGSTGEEWHSRF
jgi:hypothetical protein